MAAYVASKGIMVKWLSSNRIKWRYNRANYQFRQVTQAGGIREELGQNSARIQGGIGSSDRVRPKLRRSRRSR